MKKKWSVLLILVIVGCMSLHANDGDEKTSAVYISPAAIIENNYEQDVLTVLPGANLVFESFGKRDSSLVSIGYFHGSENFIQSLRLAEALNLPNATKPAKGTSFIIPLTYTYPLTPVRAKNWRVQINPSFQASFVYANASYSEPSVRPETMEAKLMKFGANFLLGLGMYHKLGETVNLRYGVDVGVPIMGFQMVDLIYGPGSYDSEPELSFDHSGITSFFSGAVSVVPYVAIGFSY